MEQSFQARCVNGHQAHRLCIKKSCNQPSAICRVEECEYSKIHKKCFASCQVGEVVEFIMDFAKLKSKETDELVIGSINSMIKNLEMLKIEYLQLSGSLEYHMKGNNRQLFELLNKGPTNLVKPQLVTNVLEEKNGGGDEDDSIEKLKEITERVTKQHKEGIKQIRKWIKAGERSKIKFVFTEELTEKETITIFNEGKNVKNDGCKSNIIQMTLFFLCSAPLSESVNKKLIVKPVKMGHSNNYIGLARKGKLVQSKFEWTKNNEGLDVISSNGFTLNSSNGNEHRKQLPFGFKQNDVLKLEYIESTQCLKIANLATQQSVSLQSISNQQNDIHYCVYTSCHNDQWEILEQE